MSVRTSGCRRHRQAYGSGGEKTHAACPQDSHAGEHNSITPLPPNQQTVGSCGVGRECITSSGFRPGCGHDESDGSSIDDTQHHRTIGESSETHGQTCQFPAGPAAVTDSGTDMSSFPKRRSRMWSTAPLSSGLVSMRRRTTAFHAGFFTSQLRTLPNKNRQKRVQKLFCFCCK